MSISRDGGASWEALATGVDSSAGSFQVKAGMNKYHLSAREIEVLHWLIKGYSIKMIASEMTLAFDTVRSHLKNIYQKLHVNCGKEAIVKALSEHII